MIACPRCEGPASVRSSSPVADKAATRCYCHGRCEDFLVRRADGVRTDTSGFVIPVGWKCGCRSIHARCERLAVFAEWVSREVVASRGTHVERNIREDSVSLMTTIRAALALAKGGGE